MHQKVVAFCRALGRTVVHSKQVPLEEALLRKCLQLKTNNEKEINILKRKKVEKKSERNEHAEYANNCIYNII